MINAIALLSAAGCLAWIAARDAKRFTIDPPAILLLAAIAMAWRMHGPDHWRASLIEAAAGAALGIVAVAIPIGFAKLRGRRWPIMPGDGLLFAAIGVLLGPAGLAWTLIAGSVCAAAHRVCLQLRRGRRITAGYCPLGPGIAAAAIIVFAAQAADPPLRETPFRPVAATETGPAAPALPETVAGREVRIDEGNPLEFAAAVSLTSRLGEVETAVEERSGRIAGAATTLPPPPDRVLSFRGTLGELVAHIASVWGYAWEWRDGVLVFFRHHDADWPPPREPALPAATAAPWQVVPPTTLKEVLEDWAARAGWTVIWNAERRFEIAAEAVFEGNFLQAVDRLMSGPEIRRALVVRAYANDYLVIEKAGR